MAASNPNVIAMGRDLFPDADLLSLSQAMSGDVFQVILTAVFQPIVTDAVVQASVMLDFIVQMDCICNEEWLYTLAPDLATAQASTSDKWWPVKSDVEKIIPIVKPQDRVFVKHAGVAGPLAVSAWGFKTPVNPRIVNTP